jgi:hypothetical protein
MRENTVLLLLVPITFLAFIQTIISRSNPCSIIGCSAVSELTLPFFMIITLLTALVYVRKRSYH